MLPEIRSLNILLVGSKPFEAGVLSFINVVVDARKHNTVVQESVPAAITYLEERPLIDALLIYHDYYNLEPVSLQVAGRAREFYPDIPIGVISPPPVDRNFEQQLRRMCGERVFATSTNLVELEEAIIAIERWMTNPS